MLRNFIILGNESPYYFDKTFLNCLNKWLLTNLEYSFMMQ